MKALKFLVSAVLISFSSAMFAQAVIIDENFQEFKEKGWKTDTVCGHKSFAGTKAGTFKETRTYNGNKVEYSFVRCAIAPTCDSKKSPMSEGVTTGYVEVNKKDGEMTISQQPYISTIEIGASATGNERGFALYKSMNGGPWLKVGDYLGIKGETHDSQYGFSNTITINESNVSLKLTPTNDASGGPVQTFRLHNIKAYGK